MRCGSKNYEKQKYKVQLLHEKVANQRRNFCQELSAAIAKWYNAVFVEDINLRGMAGSLKLGKSTNDNGFGMFRKCWSINSGIAERSSQKSISGFHPARCAMYVAH